MPRAAYRLSCETTKTGSSAEQFSADSRRLTGLWGVGFHDRPELSTEQKRNFAFMNSRKMSGGLLRTMVVALLGLVACQAAVFGASTFLLQGQSSGFTNWITTPLVNWRELEYVPCRVLITGSTGNNQAITITFPHVTGTTPGIQDLVNFTTTGNVTIVSGPTLSDPAGADWSYALTLNYTGDTNGSVQFFARLAAGAHLNTSSSLVIGSLGKMGQLQVQKPIANLGAPDLSVVKTGPAVVAPADVVTYALSYKNAAANTNSATGVQIS